MGTIIINQTDCKQNVVLQSSVDGITGGYYDASGVWHEIGAGTEIPEIKVHVGKGTSGSSIVDNSTRAISDPFPIETNGDIQFYIPDGCSATFKLCTSDTEVSTDGLKPGLADLVGTDAYSYVGFGNEVSVGVLLFYTTGGTPHLYTLADLTGGNGNIRVMFRQGDGTGDFTADIDGYMVVDGTLYHVVKA